MTGWGSLKPRGPSSPQPWGTVHQGFCFSSEHLRYSRADTLKAHMKYFCSVHKSHGKLLVVFKKQQPREEALVLISKFTMSLRVGGTFMQKP